MLDLAQAETPTDIARSLPSSGPAWDAAIEFGIDVTLLEHNLGLTPCERMQQAAQHLRFIEAVQQRTVPSSEHGSSTSGCGRRSTRSAALTPRGPRHYAMVADQPQLASPSSRRSSLPSICTNVLPSALP